MAERSVLFDLKLNIADLEKNSKEASKRLEELKIKQALLKADNQQGSVEYAKLSNAIRATSKQLKDNASAIEINNRINTKNNGSLAEMREQLKAGSIAYAQLTKEQRENEQVGGELQKNNLALKNAINQQEEAMGNFTGSVGNYAKGIVGLKQQLKDLKNQMAGLDAGTKEYQEASEKAGELRDKIKEVNENVEASAGGTGFEKMSNNLGLIRGDLENMDFAGVSEKMKQMEVISKSMTFKETIGGLKSMGSSLLSLGRVILTNPLFLMAGIITGIVVALVKFNENVEKKAVKAQEAHTSSIKRNIEALERQNEVRNKTNDIEIELLEAEGATAREIAEAKLKAFRDEQNGRLKAFNEAKKLDEDLRKQFHDKDIKGNVERKKAIKEEIKENNAKLLELGKSFDNHKEKEILLTTQLQTTVTEEYKKGQEERIAKTKENNDKLIALQYTLRDLILDNEDKTNENQLALIEAKYDALFLANENNTDALIEIEKQKNAELTALDVLQKEDDIARLETKLERELEENKGNLKIQAELKKAFELDKAKIEIDYANLKTQRDNELIDKEKQHNLDRIANEQKTADELALINAELNYKNSAGLSNEFEMFQKFQDEKIRIIRENAEREIELNNLVGAEADKVRAKALLDVKNVEGEKFKATEVTKEKELTAEQLKLQKQTTVALNSANQLSGALFQVTQSRLTKELNLVTENYNAQSEALNKQLEDGLITENEYLTQKANIDTQFRKQSAKIKEEQFKKQKQADLIQSIINTAVGVTQVIANPPLAILAGILGATQTALIASQPTPKFAKGGVFGGNSHANGGTIGTFSDGTKIEVEKDEAFFVLNKKATQKISALSNLNQSTGGVPLMANGGSVNFNSGMTASVVASNVDSQNNMTNQLLSLITNLPTPVVAVQDINNAQNSLMNVVNFASF
jgi:hypothetical protein